MTRRNSNLNLRDLPSARVFDSETGDKLDDKDLQIQPESYEESIFLMQRWRIGNSECLTFFDSGANTHLIEKSIATNKNLQRLSECHAELGVIGGETVTAESGSVRFNLGSGQEGVYHEIRAVGMDNVTSEFAEYDLNEIRKDFISSSTEQEKDYILPKIVGGSRIHLLLGRVSVCKTFVQFLQNGM